jgi:hypothetical protein
MIDIFITCLQFIFLERHILIALVILSQTSVIVLHKQQARTFSLSVSCLFSHRFAFLFQNNSLPIT